MSATHDDDAERLRRWRLILGGDEADGVNVSLGDRDVAMDRCLPALYEAAEDKKGGG